MKITVKSESKMTGVLVNGKTTAQTMKKIVWDTMTPAQRTQYEFTQRQFNQIKSNA